MNRRPEAVKHLSFRDQRRAASDPTGFGYREAAVARVGPSGGRRVCAAPPHGRRRRRVRVRSAHRSSAWRRTRSTPRLSVTMPST